MAGPGLCGVEPGGEEGVGVIVGAKELRVQLEQRALCDDESGHPVLLKT